MLDRLRSGRYLVLEFTGLRTGPRRSPVAYIQHASRLFISTDSRWQRNVDGG